MIWLDHNAFWRKKVEATRDISRQRHGLTRCGYAGRNLIVQAMYFGRYRYWLYSTLMDKQTRKQIQDDADSLWWAREPRLAGDK